MFELTTEKTTGTIGAQTAQFIPTHREGNDSPVALTLTMNIPMSLDDLTAALWIAAGTWPDDEVTDLLTDVEWLHSIVLETVFAAGGSELEDARLSFAELEPGTVAFARLAQLRGRVAELYGKAPACRRARKSGARRELAGVAS